MRFWLLLPVVAAATMMRVPVAVPHYDGPALDASKPLGGLLQAKDVITTCIHRGVPETGTYNHAAMIDYHDGMFVIAWKNGEQEPCHA